jgi:lipopolysaccharide export LptBFGC system permease protein LptF
MRLRKIDIYVMKAFLAWFGVSFMGIVGFYLVFDLFTRLHKFFDFEKSEILGRILQYYLWHTPYQLTQFLPLVTLMGAMFALARMAKMNELVPIMSSGVSLYRVVGVIFIMASFIMAIMYGVQEFFMPAFADKVVEAVSKPREAKSIGDLLYDEAGHIVHYQSFDPDTAQMAGVTISLLKNDKGQYKEWGYWYADTAAWAPATVVTLKDGRRLWGFMHAPAENELLVVTADKTHRLVTKNEVASERFSDPAPSLHLKSGTTIECQVYTPAEDEVILLNGKRFTAIPKDEIAQQGQKEMWVLRGRGVCLDYETMMADRDGPGVTPPREWQHEFGDYPYVFVTRITPREALLKRFDPSYETLLSLARQIQQYPDYEVWRVALFARLVDPLTNIVLLLVGIPFVLSTERRSMFLSLGKCVLLFLVFYLFTFINHNLGESKHLPPWVAVSLPIVMFTSIGVYMFDRIRT